MKNRILLLLCCVVCLSFLAENGMTKELNQNDLKVVDSTYEQIVELKSGSIYYGRIIEIQSDSIEFKTNETQFMILISNIKNIQTISKDKSKSGEYWYSDRNQSRLFFSPTGKTLPKGDAYLIDYYLFFPAFSYGVTDQITIGGGISLFPGISMNEQLYYFTPKVGLIQFENYSFAVSAFIFQFPKETEEFGFIFGMNTYQKDRLQLTGGIGYGYYDGDLSDNVAVIVGFNYRMSEQVAFLSENWFIPGDNDPVVSYGLRFIGEKIAVDLGLFTLLDDDPLLPGIIYGNFVFHF